MSLNEIHMRTLNAFLCAADGGSLAKHLNENAIITFFEALVWYA